MKERSYNFRLPIFDPCNAWLVVSDSVAKSRSKRSAIFGPWNYGGVVGLCSYDSAGKFALFFNRRNVTHSLIAHEVFHATIRMLEYCEVHVPVNGGHESHAYLCGHLTEIVYRKMKQWGVEIE